MATEKLLALARRLEEVAAQVEEDGRGVFLAKALPAHGPGAQAEFDP